MAPVEARQIVLAGPGAGKTEVVGRLTEKFVEDGAHPEEILVVSFSRAALTATRYRTGHILDQGRGIDLATIDSLAARILIESDDDTQFRSFDDNVRRATGVLADDGWRLDPVAHVIVDEVQDVVGDRARFVLAMLEALTDDGAGFTLLGDPMQAIYDFQIRQDMMTCRDLLDTVRARFTPRDHTLTGEYRTRNAHTAAAATARPLLTTLDSDRRLRHLQTLTVDLPPLGTIDADAVADLASWTGTTALLCDTNVRATLVAEQATKLGLPIEATGSGSDTALAPWIADLLQDHPGPRVSLDEFSSLAGSRHVPDWPDRWRLLTSVTGDRRDLSLRGLGIALQSVWRTRSLQFAPSAAFVASTVHRAKGLEFDNVVLIDPDRWDQQDEDTAHAAARRLFVALTRARSQLARLRGPDTRGWSSHSSHGSRVWLKRLPRTGGRGRPTAILMEPWMARHHGPIRIDPAAFQGSAVTWIRADELITVDGDLLPSWTAHLGDEPVARTGEAFGHLVAALTDPTLIRLPHLAGGHVEGLETVTGRPQSGIIGRHGFWTGARVGGTVTFTPDPESY